MIVHTEFQRVSLRPTKKGKCPICGRSVQRSTKIENTVNPFNRNERGEVKTFNEVLDDVREKARTWEPDFRHQKCIDEASA
jgi:hypothetical protein